MVLQCVGGRQQSSAVIIVALSKKCKLVGITVCKPASVTHVIVLLLY